MFAKSMNVEQEMKKVDSEAISSIKAAKGLKPAEKDSPITLAVKNSVEK